MGSMMVVSDRGSQQIGALPWTSKVYQTAVESGTNLSSLTFALNNNLKFIYIENGNDISFISQKS